MEHLLQKGRIVYSWSNASVLINCFNEDKNNEDGILYFGKPEKTLNTYFENPIIVDRLTDQVDNLSIEQKDKIVRFMENVPFSLNTYITYIKLLNYKYYHINIDNLSQEMLTRLVEEQMVPASVEMIADLIHYGDDDLAVTLIEDNEVTFFSGIEWVEELEISQKLLTDLIQSNKLSDAARQTLLLDNQTDIIETVPHKYWINLILPKVVERSLPGISRVKASELDNQKLKLLGLEPSQPQLDYTLLVELLNLDDVEANDKLRLLVGQLSHLGEDLWSLLKSWKSIPDSLSLNEEGKPTGKVKNRGMEYIFCCGLVHHNLISSFAVSGEILQISHKRKC